MAKRVYRCQAEFGPYITTDRKRFSWWHQVIGDNIVTAVQCGRKVLYKATLDTTHPAVPPMTCDMDFDKWIIHFGGHHMYCIVEPELRKVTRPFVALTGNDVFTASGDMHHFDCGHATDTIAKWREA